MSKEQYNAIKSYIKHHYRHFNAAAVIDAAEGYRSFLAKDNHMLLAMAGAMSTAELGRAVAG
jgi:deoxyhypusine synthase